MTDHAHVLPLHRRVGLLLQTALLVAGATLSATALLDRSLSFHTACTAAITGLLCAGCFAHWLLREQRGLVESERKSVTLAVLIVCLFCAGLRDSGLVAGQRVDFLVALVSALRHVVLPLGVFMYWLVFCGPVRLGWRMVMPSSPVLGGLYFSMIHSIQGRPVRWPLRLLELQPKEAVLLHAGLLVLLFAGMLVGLKLVKKYLLTAAVRSAAFGDWDAAIALRQSS
ncbi:hypothetical protein [Herbaspirillum rubrisubalbicans]|uniref:Uncharacterized protein n=1 Tax=Herbaspirillum rubrisubalbicans TaxID=80842 RepID=A0AAD0U3Z0_9BURK|nr:hypothetical protein [Herbaspirillum rubrisubalbicans]AYR22768.1 hypothetical protein RC54_02575 [Herbaspirillum rubrisubalbicans]